jgi:hypothetical protein
MTPRPTDEQIAAVRDFAEHSMSPDRFEALADVLDAIEQLKADLAEARRGESDALKWQGLAFAEARAHGKTQGRLALYRLATRRLAKMLSVAFDEAPYWERGDDGKRKLHTGCRNGFRITAREVPR